MLQTLFTIFFPLIAPQNTAQAYSDNKSLMYQDHEYEDKVRSVLVKQLGSDERFPMVYLDNGNGLGISFDMLESENDYFQFTFVHCDRNWNPSSLNKTDFIDGNMFENISQFKFSSNTYVQYTHYDFQFPMPKMKPKIGGNYLLVVYRNFDEEDIILTRRLLVLNPRTKVTGRVRSATNAYLRFTHQEIDFNVDASDYAIPNPFTDLHAVVLQNYSWFQTSLMMQPQFANANKFTFNYEKENVVSGLNEFRFFDSRGLRTFASGVKSKYYDSARNQIGINLYEDANRGAITYLYWQDNNGKTVYGNRDLPNIANSEDYLVVNFELKNSPLFNVNEDLYVLGEFNNWLPTPVSKLNKLRNGNYGVSLTLKQGYYNYFYGRKEKDGNLDFSITEGVHQETENDYRVLVYCKNQFLRYDELVGFLFLNTLNANTKE